MGEYMGGPPSARNKARGTFSAGRALMAQQPA